MTNDKQTHFQTSKTGGFTLCLLVTLAGLLTGQSSQAQELVSGVVTPVQQAKLAFESSGVLASRVRLGQKVEQGQELAQLNRSKEEAALAKAQAELNIAENELNNTRRTRDNMKKLHRTNAVSENDLIEAQIALSQAEARLLSSKASLESAQINLQLKTLKAPFSGVVTDVKLQAGEYLEAGDNILTLADIDQLQLSVDIPLNLSLSLKKETETKIHDSGRDVGVVRIDTILPVLDPASGLRRVVWRVTPLNPDEVLAGRYVQLRSWEIQKLAE